MNTLKDKILGSMLGGAVGDALGYVVEFKTYDQIVACYGAEGITRYKLTNGVAEISDDTQMSLYTAEGVLADDIQGAYLEWYATQTQSKPLENPKFDLSKLPAMYERRAPGHTCLSALSDLSRGCAVNNQSKGCGGVMRVAPIALYGAAHEVSAEESARRACEAARITHQHPLGWLPAGVLAYTIQRMIESKGRTCEALIATVREALQVVGRFEGATAEDMAELQRGSEQAIELSQGEWPDEQAICTLGEGWTGEEAWYIALYCVLRHIDDFEGAVIAAVNHSGDSDSTGAVAGNLSGAIVGASAIPEHFKEHLEFRSEIERLAGSLAHNPCKSGLRKFAAIWRFFLR